MAIIRIYRQSEVDALTLELKDQIAALAELNDVYLDLLAECRDACGDWNATRLRAEAMSNPSVVPLVVKEKIEMLKEGNFS